MDLFFKPSLTETIRLYDGVPSVTSILSVLEDPIWIKKWKESATDPALVEQTIDNARKRGTYVHLVASNYYKKSELKFSEEDLSEYKKEYDLPDLNPKIIKFLNGFNKFIGQESVLPMSVEEPLISKRLGFAGTPDLIGFHEDKLT
ncbi:MAG: hypothetical protein EOM67_17105, partial [Spirochaetia bacterium]|nr:hypothetical protein [Spirochaetia bacterium]